jgi:hypothetical protein
LLKTNKTMTAIPAYDEVAVLLAQLDPYKIINLKPSQSSCERLSVLLEKNQNSSLNHDENYELDRLLALDHLIALAKVHARIQLNAA